MKALVLGDRTFTEEDILLADRTVRKVFDCSLMELVDSMGDAFEVEDLDAFIDLALIEEAGAISQKEGPEAGIAFLKIKSFFDERKDK